MEDPQEKQATLSSQIDALQDTLADDQPAAEQESTSAPALSAIVEQAKKDIFVGAQDEPVDDQILSELRGIQDAVVKNASMYDPAVADYYETRALRRASETDQGLFSAAWESTTAASGILQEWKRNNEFAPDPTFKLQDHMEELTKGLPAEFDEEFIGVRSLQEGLAVRRQIQKEQDTLLRLHSAGWKGTAAVLAASLMDLDAPLVFASFGTGAAAKAGLFAARTSARLGAGAKAAKKIGMATYAASESAVTGAAIGGGLGFLQAATHPTFSASDAVSQALGGMFLGGAVGGALGATKKTNNLLTKQIDEYAATAREPQLAEYFAKTTTGKEFGSGPAEWVKAAEELKAGAAGTIKDNTLVRGFLNWWDKTPLATDAHVLWNSKSPTARLLAYAMFESAPGLWRNNKSAALLKGNFYAESAQHLVEPYYPAFYKFAADRGYSGRLGKARAYLGAAEVKKEFNWEVAKEMNRRELGKPENPNLHPAVKEYCDAVDNGTDIIRRRAQEAGVEGFETMPRMSGYMPRMLNGRKIMEAVGKAANGEASVRGLLIKAFKAASPTLDDAMAETIAKAFITRARGKARDMDMQVLNLVSSDSRAFIKETMLNNGISEADTDRIVNVLMGNVDERGKVGYGKHRMAMDLDIEYDGITMADIVDYDVISVYGHYAQTMAGRTAAAAKGIGSTTRLNAILTEIMKDDPEIGGSVIGLGVSGKDYLRALMAPFFGGADEAHLLPFVRRITQLTTLGTMSMLGLPQLAEAGAQIATVGLNNWLKAFPEAWKAFRGTKEERRALAEDLRGLTGQLGREWALYRPDLNLEYGRYTAEESMRIAAVLDEALAKGLQIQSHISLFNQVKQLQTETVLIAYTDKIMRMLKKNAFTDSDIARLADSGFDAAFLKRIKDRYLDTGTIEFLPDGTCDRINLNKWNSKDALQFNLSMRRFIGQVIQRGEEGEGWLWARSNVGKLLTQFKSFPMLAVQKQVARNLALNDSVTYMTALYGLMTAAVAYSVRETLNGRYERLTPEKIYKGAVGMSNLTGWLPMYTDPVASILGLDSLMFDDYSKFASADVLNVPAFNVVAKQLRMPAALLDALLPGREYTKEDAVTLGATPILGSMLGARRLFALPFD